MYLAVKHLHLTLIAIAFGFFLLRSFWLFTRSPLLQKKLLKVLPHPINLLMILSGFTLAYVAGYPLSSPWIIAKLVALVKPQFEAGREEVGKGGVVRDPDVHDRV